MLLRPGSRLTGSGRPTPYSPSWRACDYADTLHCENQGSFATDAVPQLRRGIIRESALLLAARHFASGVAGFLRNGTRGGRAGSAADRERQRRGDEIRSEGYRSEEHTSELQS